jgi:deoxyribonuclease-4
MLLLENSAGAGSLLGHSPEELADVVGASRQPDRLGICIDTAHAFAAGYPIISAAGLDDFLALLDRRLTPERLKLIHFNDSKAPFGARVDRHWHIGKGQMGKEGLARIVNHPRLRDVPFIMETPEADLRHDRMNMRAFERLLRPATRRARRPAHGCRRRSGDGPRAGDPTDPCDPVA